MRVLVFGTTGQLGRSLARAAATRGVELLALGRAEADLADPAACAAAVATAKVDAVINAAAYTAVDRAEAEPALAHRVNAEAPGAMAAAAAERGVPFLHVSTDQVFDGRPGRPWREDDPPAPLNVYGASKLAGERAVAAAGGAHAIVRTAWLFSAQGSNFVSSLLRAGATQDHLRVVHDQRSGPTPAVDLADALLTIAAAMAAGGAGGVYHFTGAPAVSKAEFAEAVFAARGGTPPTIERIPSNAWPSAAARPLNAVLDCGKITAAYGIPQPAWRARLAEVMGELA